MVTKRPVIGKTFPEKGNFFPEWTHRQRAASASRWA